MIRLLGILLLALLPLATQATAQDLRVATVTRPPFSMVENGVDTGFSLDLWAALMEEMEQSYEVVRVEEFQEMLDLVQSGEVDAAVANISITASREMIMDYSQPIFESGLQVMVPASGQADFSIWNAILSRDLLIAVAMAFGLLLGGGMLMWLFERRAQPYFDRPAKEALFPSFWWALNLVVNGGFEERMPRTFFGRIFGVFLVVSSLFIVSIFVANITAVMTVKAIQSSVNSISDLEGKLVGTTAGSTASVFLAGRDIRFEGYEDLESLLAAFEAGDLDAVVFDAPILAYYVNTRGRKLGELKGSVFLREDYGIAFPTNSPLAEPVNQALLRLKENGTYDDLSRKWFGRVN
ncbi:Glutamine-binding periplasmic protein precursor [Pseudoruegeria aquimaris]|uniref:Glutamine-binding periplasmic protein n=1 Tax=Pseudoruegeria aquimaris TaxID=393663 RepID=A0A1Y5RZQ0_9RHOB|nr:transporter substrate-binding domain-containing protein [Pseudoruegeria aquimaris]SLN28667.1 Glutamine-binding periplasmic protein precursor [Pseudoruegeria aquimaris]